MENTPNTGQRTHHLRIVRPYISAEAERFANEYELGKATAEYGTRCSPLKMLYSGCCLLLGVLLIVVMLMTEEITGQAIALVCALFFLGMGMIAPGNWLIRRSWYVVTCVEGFLVVKGKRVEVCRWEQVEKLWQRVFKQYYRGLSVGASHKYSMQCDDGRRIVLNDAFAHIEKFGNTIGREVTQNLLPTAIMAFTRGDAVAFGKISIDSKGIHDGKELLAWNQVKSVMFSQEAVTIRQERKTVIWSAVKVARIPNIMVFMGLVEYVMGHQRFGGSVSR